MAKDPAFLFYSSDFLNGVSDLTMQERGQYITLLCLQHQKDTLTPKTISLSVGSVSVDVMQKFLKDKEGNFFNQRLFEEIEKRKNFTNSRRLNGLKGGRGNKSSKASAKHMGNHMEDENENENKDKKENKIEIIMPWDSENFKTAWANWIQFKRVEFKQSYKSSQTEQSVLHGLKNKANGDELTAIAIINQSIENQWKGLFELKSTNYGNNKHKQQSGHDLAKSAMEHLIAKKMGGSPKN